MFLYRSLALPQLVIFKFKCSRKLIFFFIVCNFVKDMAILVFLLVISISSSLQPLKQQNGLYLGQQNKKSNFKVKENKVELVS